MKSKKRFKNSCQLENHNPTSYLLSRRQFIKTMGLAGLALFTSPFLFSTPSYGFNKKELTFAEIYPVPFYKKDWFVPTVIAATVVATAAFLFFTAGAGAPAAAPGVSTIASWIGGGGAGSYMAGLSTVGSWFGGNAILGAAILNSISLTFLGGIGATSKAGLSTAATIVALSDLSLLGIQVKEFFSKRENKSSGLLWQIPIPYDIGSKYIKDEILEPLEEVSDEISDIQEKFSSYKEEECEAIREKNKDKVKKIEIKIKELNIQLKKLNKKKDLIFEKAMQIFKRNFHKLNIEDLIILTIIANNNLEFDMFKKGLQKLDSYAKHIEKRSFVDYLKGIYFMEENNYESAKKSLYEALRQEPYVVEIGIALTIALSKDYKNNKNLILKVAEIIEKNYDDDNYQGRNLPIFYYHLGTIALMNKDYKVALYFFQKAYGSLPFIVRHIPLPHMGPLKHIEEVKNFFQFPIAITYKSLGEEKKAKEILDEILERCNSQVCKNICRQKYIKMYEYAGKPLEVQE